MDKSYFARIDKSVPNLAVRFGIEGAIRALKIGELDHSHRRIVDPNIRETADIHFDPTRMLRVGQESALLGRRLVQTDDDLIIGLFLRGTLLSCQREGKG